VSIAREVAPGFPCGRMSKGENRGWGLRGSVVNVNCEL